MGRYQLPYLEWRKPKWAAAPGPTGSRMLGVLEGMRRDPYDFLLDAARTHGPVARLPAGPRWCPAVMHLVASPEGIRHVLIDNRHNYPKSIAYTPVRDLVGDGLVTSEGDRWAADRRALAPHFSPQRTLDATSSMAAASDRLARQWADAAEHGRAVDVAEDMKHLTLDVLGNALLGVSIGDDRAGEIGDLLEGLLHDTEARMMSLWGLATLWNRFISSPANRRAKTDLARLQNIAEKLLDTSTTAKDSIVETLAVMTQNGQLSRAQAVDHALTFVLAGHETTTTTLTYAWQLLAHHPDTMRTLRDESTAVLGEGPVLPEHRNRLPYTEAVIKETMRLYPAAWIVERDALEQDEIHGYTVPAKGMVLLSPYVTHRLPDLWDNPEKFQPERFLDRPVPEGAYLPFGAGTRNCIGSGFATWEAIALLASLARWFTPSMDRTIVPPAAAVTLRPSQPVVICLSP